MMWRLFFLTILVFSGQGLLAQDNMPPSPMIIMAGVPRYLSAERDYDRLFAELAAYSVDAFLPTFQYEEVPEARSTGFEHDFILPCQHDNPAFVAMREHDIKLVIPAQLLYDPVALPSLEDDPLLRLQTCIGDDMIAAVFSIDEPALNGVERSQVESIYERVQQVAPEIPVIMVHAPLNSDLELDAANTYLEQVLHFSSFADIVGFDVYPIPQTLFKLTTPDAVAEVAAVDTIISDYLSWQETTIPDKETLIVLQAFALHRLYAEPPLQTSFPTESELRSMLCQAMAADVRVIAWWGSSFLVVEDAPFMEMILDLSASLKANPTVFCDAQG